ncbi:MAG: single-stranded-DNA-specific exonuclease RecJ, partial [Pseudomonadota bacterium]
MILTEKSFGNARWVMADTSMEEVQHMMRSHDVPEIVARMLVSRGVSVDEAGAFMSPTLKDHFPDPFSLADMRAAAEFIAEKVTAQESIAIFGDFDVDGATSSAVLYRFLKACGIEAPIYIPDRLSEGYGPNIEALKSLKEQGAKTVIILDCGTTAFDVVEQGRELGLDIVILDHHEAEDKLTAANFTINPKRQDDKSGLDMLAAVGVTFLFCVAVNAVLKEQGAFQGKAAPDLKTLLDLVALGTVCDMVPLTGPNRLFVKAGFRLMQATQNRGLQALIKVSGIEGTLNPYHAGYILGPRINAGSRIHKADLGANLLSTEEDEEALNIAWTLNDCNDKRKSIQKQMEAQAIEMVEAQGLEGNAIILVDHEDFHPGLSGLVAGRLKEKYKKPACVVTYAKNEQGGLEGRGSGRSVPGIHIAKAFIDARAEGLLIKGGGHAMAGGFTIMPDQWSAFKEFMNAHIEKQAEAVEPNIDIAIDSVVTVRGVQTA